MIRLATRAALVGVLLTATGCASLIPVGSVLEGMDADAVDTVVGKVASRYQSVARLSASEGLVIGLDSIVVGTPLKTKDERRLVSSIASYMLGETIGKQWVSRVEGELAVFGEGQVHLVVYRSVDGSQYLVDALGSITLFLPLSGGENRSDGVEALSFDLRASNQPIQIGEGSGVTYVYIEVLPRSAIYASEGPMFKRWAGALFQLGWAPPGTAAADAPGDGAHDTASSPADDRGRRSEGIRNFLEHSRAFVGPVVRLEFGFERQPSGATSIVTGRSNTVDLVLPHELIAGDRALEQALERFSHEGPDRFSRTGSDLLIRVGHYFFHTDVTGPSDLDPALREQVPALKEFRIPPRSP
ncbi:MAG: hypothetical protein ACYTFT_00370 [Planctomycetota bacterium]